MRIESNAQGMPIARRPTPVEHTVRVGPLMSIPSILLEFGCRPEPLFEGVGLDLAQFDEPDNEIPFVAGSRLLAACVLATGCQHFGLLVGKRAHPSSLGVAGFMLRAAPDVDTALRTLLLHLELHDQGGILTLTKGADTTLFGYAICLPAVEAADQIYDLSVTLICNVMRGLCGQTWKPNEVLLSRRAPPDLKPYRQFFRAPLRFNAPQSALMIDSHWLNHRLASADPLLFHHLEKEAEKLHTQQTVSTADRLRQLLRKSLAKGNFSNTNCAKQFCMHERTLHRRLEEEGTNFRQVLDDMRYDLAQQMLAETTMPLSEIAKAVGYADTTAFVRSFKRWSAVTPAQWRVNNSGRQNGGSL